MATQKTKQTSLFDPDIVRHAAIESRFLALEVAVAAYQEHLLQTRLDRPVARLDITVLLLGADLTAMRRSIPTGTPSPIASWRTAG